MKNIILISLLLSTLVYSDLSIDQIEKMVSKIHEKREGVNLETLNLTKEPFVRLEKEDNVTSFIVPQQSEEVKISLHAIMSGKAYINESWKDINETVMGYTLMYVGKKGVVLRNGNHIKKLFLHENKNDFIKIEGR